MISDICINHTFIPTTSTLHLYNLYEILNFKIAKSYITK